MAIFAELPDGRKLEFPDGTDPGVIQGAVKKTLGIEDLGPQTPGPVSGPDPTFGTPMSVAAGDPDRVGKGPLSPAGMSVRDAVLEEAPQAIGSIAGAGIAASGLVAGGSVIAPLAVGAGLGGGFGESMKQIGQHLSGSLDAPKTSIEAAKRIGEASLTEAGFEMVGGLVAKGFGKILAPFAKTVKEGVGEAMEYFKGKISPVLLPAEATESRVLDILHNVSEASLIGGNQISKYKTERLKFFDDFADSIIDQFGARTSPDDLGNLFVTSLEASKQTHQKAANILYNNVDELVGTEVVEKQIQKEVETGLLDETGKPLMRTVTETVKVPEPKALVKTKELKDFASKVRVHSTELGGIEAKNAGDDLMAAIADLPDNLDFGAAQELRSRLISRVDEFSVINKKAPAIGKAKRMISLIDSQMEEALEKSSPEALEAWRTANRFYKTGQEKFNNTFLRRLIKLADDTGTGAENIAPAIFRPGQVSKVRKAKRALGEGSEEWGKMKGFFAQHLLSKSTNPEGVVMGQRLLNNMTGKPNSFGEQVLNEVFTAPQLREIKHFATVLAATQARQGEGAGKVLIQLTQAGAMASLVTGNMTGPSMAIIMGPPVLSKLMLNPTTARILTEGISLPANSAAAAGVMSRLAAAVERIHRQTTGE